MASTKAAMIMKVLTDTMLEYMRIRATQTFGNRTESPTDSLEIPIPNTGFKLHLHVDKNNGNTD